MIYLFLVNVTLIVFYSLYIGFLKRLTFFQWNRFYLLGSVLFSLLVPLGIFIDTSDPGFIERTLPALNLTGPLYGDSISSVIDTSDSLSHVMPPVYWTGVLLSLCWLAYRLRHAYRFAVNADSIVSFAFFNKVVLGAGQAENGIVLAHERIHVKQRHTYDVLFIETVHAFNWFNPVLFLYLKELKFQHECIADAACAEDRIAYAELLIAQAMHINSFPLLHEFSNESALKKRIRMLFTARSKSRSKYLYFSIMPALLLSASLTWVFNVSYRSIHAAGNVAAGQIPSDMKSSWRGSLSALQLSDFRSGMPIDAWKHQRTSEDEKGSVFTAVDISPQPRLGFHHFRRWIGENYRYPQEAIDAGNRGKALVSFVVESDGALSNFRIIDEPGYGIGEEIINLLKKADAWLPGQQNGLAVRVAYTLPITFNLEK